MRGFSLLETAVVVTISGLVLSAGLQFYKIHIDSQRKKDTYAAQENFDNAVNAFYSFQKRYPCPADPALPTTDPQAGIENCISSTAVGACSGGICKVAGRDADGDGDPDDVLVGGMPYKTLKLGRDDLNPYDGVIQDDIAACNRIFLSAGALAPPCPATMSIVLEHATSTEDFTSEDAIDAWGNRMTYAVSSRLTSNAIGVFDISYGAITVETETGLSLSDPPGSVMWVAVSHGKDGNGAYDRSSTSINACGGAADSENCDGDSVFASGIFSAVPGAGYFDDMIYYSATRLSSLWTNAQTNPVTGSNEALDITNRNIGNIGVGLPDGTVPTEKLEVANILRAQNFMSPTICDSAGVNCFDPASFGSSTGSSCPPPASGTIQVMTKIANGGIQCTAVTLPTYVPAQTCPAGEVMRGINNLGAIICAAP